MSFVSGVVEGVVVCVICGSAQKNKEGKLIVLYDNDGVSKQGIDAATAFVEKDIRNIALLSGGLWMFCMCMRVCVCVRMRVCVCVCVCMRVYMCVSECVRKRGSTSGCTGV